MMLLAVASLLAGAVFAGCTFLVMNGWFSVSLALAGSALTVVWLVRQGVGMASDDPLREHETLRVLLLYVGLGLLAGYLPLQVASHWMPAVVPPTIAFVAGMLFAFTGQRTLRNHHQRRRAVQEATDA